jgi:hypothetical protein
MEVNVYLPMSPRLMENLTVHGSNVIAMDRRGYSHGER